MKNLFLGIILYILAQILTWFQMNSQFIFPWFKRNPLIVSIVGGTLISYIFIIATRIVAEQYEGLLYPGRFIGFSVGIVVFGILTYFLMGEGINLKTLISLTLAFGIILIQIYIK